jgi:surface antigen
MITPMKYLNILILALALVLAGCASDPSRGMRETTGTLAGAALGGLLGAQFGGGKGQLVATGIGVLLGGLIGSEIGRSMDEVDRIKANEAVTRAHTAPLGQRITWNNPDNNHYGSITPVRDGYSDSGRYCREFYQTVSIAGKAEEAYGVACRQADGTWRIVSN